MVKNTNEPRFINLFQIVILKTWRCVTFETNSPGRCVTFGTNSPGRCVTFGTNSPISGSTAYFHCLLHENTIFRLFYWHESQFITLVRHLQHYSCINMQSISFNHSKQLTYYSINQQILGTCMLIVKNILHTKYFVILFC